MRHHSRVAFSLALALSALTVVVGGIASTSTLVANDAARDALSPRPDVATRAIDALRAEGPRGLDRLMRLQPGAPAAACVPATERWRAAVDRVAAQRDAHASGLFWYTDLDAARSAARASGRPILSLRLLGRLDEELSCANSRLFRTVLYANADVARALRDGWVLHWESVRPAPRITVDYGDGRVLERTVTGNSIHYVLDADGRVVDALPGLWGPGGFLRELRAAAALARSTASLADGAADDTLRAFHARRVDDARRRWRDLMVQERRAATTESRLTVSDLVLVEDTNAPLPDAYRAGELTTSKMAVERPLLRELRGDSRGVVLLDAWERTRVGRLYAGEARLDASSRALLRSKLLPAPGGDLEARVARVVAALERGLAEDQVQNEFAMRPALDRMLAEPGAVADLRALNARVYADVFLTPDSDPWLGLAPPDEYAALDGEGRVVAAR